ncbi:hypothetical protein ACLBX9_08470 [Methylobacterium sp. A49B]
MQVQIDIECPFRLFVAPYVVSEKRTFSRRWGRAAAQPPETGPFASEKRVGFSIAGETLLWDDPDMLVGYARFSARYQNIDLQRDA